MLVPQFSIHIEVSQLNFTLLFSQVTMQLSIGFILLLVGFVNAFTSFNRIDTMMSMSRLRLRKTSPLSMRYIFISMYL